MQDYYLKRRNFIWEHYIKLEKLYQDEIDTLRMNTKNLLWKGVIYVCKV